MKRILTLILVLLFSIALADMPVPSNAVGALYTRSDDGSLNFTCTVSKVKLDEETTFLLTAAHCLQVAEIGGNVKAMYPQFASFDDGLSFLPVEPLEVGDKNKGFDVAAYIPTKETAAYKAIKPLSLSKRQSLVADETIWNWSYPAGIGLVGLSGKVILPVLDRPVFSEGINWMGYVGLNLNITGGSSGSPVFDRKGEVIGIVVGSISQRAWQVTTMLPIWKIF